MESIAKLLLFRPDLVDGVVAGHDDGGGADLLRSSLELSDEAVLVCPDLEVMTETSSFLVEVINDHCLGVGLKSAPPLVTVLEEGSRALGPGCCRLTDTGGAPKPVGVGLREVFSFILSGLEGLDVHLVLKVVGQRDVAIPNCLFCALLEKKGVLLLHVPGYVEPGLWHPDDDGCRAGHPGLCLLAVLPGLEGVLADREVAFAEPLLNSEGGYGVLDAKRDLVVESGDLLRLGGGPD